MITADINYWAVIVSAVVSIVIGGVWYTSRVFGTSWMTIIGKNHAVLKTQISKTMFVKKFVATLLLVYVLAHIIDYTGSTTFGQGIATGFWLWLGFVATTTFINTLYKDEPLRLWAVNAGYQLAVFVVSGAILASWT